MLLLPGKNWCRPKLKKEGKQANIPIYFYASQL